MRVYDEVLRDHVAMVCRAAEFAARKHSQAPNGASPESRIMHLAEVAHLIAASLEEPDAYLVAAAWLHHTMDETETTRDELVSLFGEQVAALVVEVTDDQSRLKAGRKRAQVATMEKWSETARLLKLVDTVSTLRSLAASRPAGWDDDRCTNYLAWAERVVSPCKRLSAPLGVGV